MGGGEEGGDGGSFTSIYAMFATWLTPTYLFIFLNLIIGTIAITSRSACRRRRQLDSCTTPSPSFLDRVTSFGLRCCNYEMAATVSEAQMSAGPVQKNNDSPCLDRAPSTCETESAGAPDQGPDDQGPDDLVRNQLPRAPSLLERIVSMNFRRSESMKSEKGSRPELDVTSGGKVVDGLMEEEKGVDARADDFIKSFKQQLRLQRLDSILRYRNMLRRN